MKKRFQYHIHISQYLYISAQFIIPSTSISYPSFLLFEFTYISLFPSMWKSVYSLQFQVLQDHIPISQYSDISTQFIVPSTSISYPYFQEFRYPCIFYISQYFIVLSIFLSMLISLHSSQFTVFQYHIHISQYLDTSAQFIVRSTSLSYSYFLVFGQRCIVHGSQYFNIISIFPSIWISVHS